MCLVTVVRLTVCLHKLLRVKLILDLMHNDLLCLVAM